MKLRIRGKLLIAALSVSVACLGMGAVGVLNIGIVARQSRAVYEKTTLPFEHLYTLDEAYEETRIGIRDVIYATDPATEAEQRKGVEEHFAEVEKEAAEFEKEIQTEDAEKTFADFQAAYADYKAAMRSTLALDLAKKDTEALAVLNGSVKDATTRLEDALDKLAQSRMEQAKIRVDDNDVVARRATFTMASIAVGVFAVCFIFGLGFAISLSRPIWAAAAVAGRIAAGDLTKAVEVKYKRRSDEMGTLASSLDTMRSDLAGSVGDIRSSVGIIQEMGQDLAANMEETAAAVTQIGETIDSLGGRVISQGASVTETSATIDQIIRNIDFLNGEIEDQAASVAQSSASIEQMVGNIRSVSTSVEHLGEAFGQLVSASDDGRDKLSAVNALVRSIAGQSEKLFEANSVITDIANQTNLLAMNAAIEAAHAGEAGRGFAVVADEIRKLAEISASRSKDISTDVRSIKSSIDSVVGSSDAAELSFTTILDLIESLSTLEREIKQAMSEQGEGSKQVLEALSRINDITQRVKAGSAEMNEGSKAIGAEMGNLLETSEQLKSDMAEIARGTGEIKQAAEAVSAMSVKNARLIDDVSSKVARYTLA